MRALVRATSMNPQVQERSVVVMAMLIREAYEMSVSKKPKSKKHEYMNEKCQTTCFLVSS